ncbi:TrmH family RNA methyltransferase [Johnsonella ignava]|uniref:TrmH family RNA methyltransferase n=1 Tax=Johnsonella ignava TaxID=43995 RepID=UPI0023EF9730|nr:RNA methyltransferase [Johnsonella ignava]
MITSTSNKNIKEITALIKKSSYRKSEGCYVVEGIKMFKELPDKYIKKIYISEKLYDRLYYSSEVKKSNVSSVLSACDKKHRAVKNAAKSDDELKAKLDRHSFEVLKQHVFESTSETSTPQGILAVASKQEYTLEGILKRQYASANIDGALKLLVLDTIQDPGNLGTIIRAGEAAGIDGVIMGRGTADIYSPKVTRSTMGSLFRVPFIYTDDLLLTVKDIKRENIKVYAAEKDEGINYDRADLINAAALIIGNESGGISDDILKEADSLIKIPMTGSVESLNAAIAASILMFEITRQRRAV